MNKCENELRKKKNHSQRLFFASSGTVLTTHLIRGFFLLSSFKRFYLSKRSRPSSNRDHYVQQFTMVIRNRVDVFSMMVSNWDFGMSLCVMCAVCTTCLIELKWFECDGYLQIIIKYLTWTYINLLKLFLHQYENLIYTYNSY